MQSSLRRCLRLPASFRGTLLAVVFASPLLLAARGEEAIAPGGSTPAIAVEPETTRAVLGAAGSHLGTYIKPYGANFCVSPIADATWVELQGLAYGDARAGILTAADRADGIGRRLQVGLKYESHRSLRKDGTWSGWESGIHPAVPRTVTVEHRGGEWTASSGAPDLLRPAGSGAVSLPVRPSFLESAPTPAEAFAQGEPRRAVIPPPVPATPPLTTPAAAEDTASSLASPVSRAATGFAIVGISTVLIMAWLRRGQGKRPGRLAAGSRAESAAAETASGPPDLPVSPFAPGSPTATGARRPPTGLAAYTPRSHLHTPAEREFHRHLASLLGPGCAISGKVRLADLFDAPSGAAFQAAFNSICSKHVDFVIIDHHSSRVLAAVELDDASHNRKERKERDQFLDSLFLLAPFPLIRIPIKSMRDSALLTGHLRGAAVPLADTAYAPAAFASPQLAPAT